MKRTLNISAMKHKACGHAWTFNPKDWCEEGLLNILHYGASRRVQDYANSQANAYKTKTGRKMSDEARRKLVVAAIDSLKERGQLPGATSLDPVYKLALQLAETFVLNRMGAANRLAGQNHPAWGKYFSLTAKGGTVPNVEALMEVLDKVPSLREDAAALIAKQDEAVNAAADVDLW